VNRLCLIHQTQYGRLQTIPKIQWLERRTRRDESLRSKSACSRPKKKKEKKLKQGTKQEVVNSMSLLLEPRKAVSEIFTILDYLWGAQRSLHLANEQLQWLGHLCITPVLSMPASAYDCNIQFIFSAAIIGGEP
jgi:hypothetical protein